MGGHLHRAGAALVALAGGAALVCAGVALAAAGDPQRHFNKADQAIAKAFVLLKADLPGKGWEGKPTDFSQPNPACFVKHYSLAALTVTGEAGFTYVFMQGGAEAASDGHVFKTGPEAASAFATLSKPGLARCVGSSFAESVAKSAKGATARVVRVTPVPLAGLAAKANAFRVEISVSVGGKTGPLEVVIVNLRNGRSLGSLNLVGPTKAWSVPLVRRLAQKMALRMAR